MARWWLSRVQTPDTSSCWAKTQRNFSSTWRWMGPARVWRSAQMSAICSQSVMKLKFTSGIWTCANAWVALQTQVGSTQWSLLSVPMVNCLQVDQRWAQSISSISHPRPTYSKKALSRLWWTWRHRSPIWSSITHLRCLRCAQSGRKTRSASPTSHHTQCSKTSQVSPLEYSSTHSALILATLANSSPWVMTKARHICSNFHTSTRRLSTCDQNHLNDSRPTQLSIEWLEILTGYFL